MSDIAITIWLLGWVTTIGFAIRFNDDGPMLWVMSAVLGLMFWPVLALVLLQQWWDGELK